jgi:hypothetical protein
MDMRKTLFCFIAFALLMGLAHGAAEIAAARDASAARDREAQLQGRLAPFPWLEPVAHTVVYYRIIFTIWVTTILVIPAFCFYVLKRPSVRSDYWVLFWTVSYLAYLTHFYWSALVLFEGNFREIMHSKLGTNPNPEKVVDNPIPDLILTIWWGLDVILAWIYVKNPRPVMIQRGILQVFAFGAFFGATVLAAKAGIIAHLLGLLLLCAVSLSFTLRIIIRRLDEGSFLANVYVGSFVVLNRFLPWHKMPTFLAVTNLGALREVLRTKNLQTTTDIPVTNPGGRADPPAAPTAEDLVTRNVDGYFNDLRQPEMGSASLNSRNPQDGTEFDKSNPGARFGRNVPRQYTYPDKARLLEPSPRAISRYLLARDKFKEASILNLLAAAWIQFETHDWFFHGEPVGGNDFSVPLETDDPWLQKYGHMVVKRTRPDPTRDYAEEERRAQQDPNYVAPPPTYANAESHWWDASQIYGDDPKTTLGLRSDLQGNLLEDGKLFLVEGLLPQDPQTLGERSGFTGNWWVGLTLLHTLFCREHNAICTALKEAYPHWSGERIFQTARLVNSALLAKIHTVEWTPAILATPALRIGMNANFWGLLGEPIKKIFGRISENESFSGIMGSETNHHTADFALTEEFVSVYRMHPLMPDELDVLSVATGRPLDHFQMLEVAGPAARTTALRRASLADYFYSFGVCHPGAITLRNFPQFLREFKRPNGDILDLAAVDILRDRERGVPRYNQFRELLHLPRVSSFEQMSTDTDIVKEMRRLYTVGVDEVDLMVGLFGETPPPGFGFSDTAFRIFIVMASRRLKSDRFFTTDFNPDVYSEIGFRWVNDNGMLSVLRRHFPALEPALRGVDNAFAPWKTIKDSSTYHPHENDPA